MLGVLFNSDEYICIGAGVYDTDVVPLQSAPKDGVFLCINPLKDKRRDANVTAYRNILIEFDSIPLDSQRRYVEELGMPYTSCVFSGKKSYHFVLSLETALPDRAAYDKLVKRIQSVVKVADKATKNPSRFTRYPGTERPDTGKVQELVDLRKRIPNADLEAWLTAHGASTFEPVATSKPSSRGSGNLIGLRRTTLAFLVNGAPPGQRHHAVFAATCDMTRVGFNRNQIQELVKNRIPLDDNAIRTIDDAISTAKRDMSETVKDIRIN